MKEFEKWRDEHYRPTCLGQQSKDKMRITWRAALEWVLLLNSVRIHDDVYEDIQKELKS